MQEFSEPSGDLSRVAGFTFPHNEDAPSGGVESCDCFSVSPNISCQLWTPIGLIRSRHPRVRTSWIGMLVPKTPVNEDNATSSRKNEVRFSWEVSSVKTEAIPEPVRKPIQPPRLHGPHEGASLLDAVLQMP